MGKKGQGLISWGNSSMSGVMDAKGRPRQMLAKLMTCDIKKPAGNGREVKSIHSRADRKSKIPMVSK